MELAMKERYLHAVELLRDQISIAMFEKYPFSLPFIRDLHSLEIDPCVTIIIGENGSGKSTLLEAVAVAWGFNPEGGTRHFNFSTHDSHSELYEHIRLVKGIKMPQNGFFLRAESFYNVATQIDAYGVSKYYGGKSLHEQSHGEAFFATFMNKFTGNGLYILDEPEAALSPMRQLAMLARIHDLVEDKSQFIIATHSPIIMGYPGAKILQVSDKGIESVEYEATEHYMLTKQFIDKRERMLKLLME
ncbi:MAG: ATPase [Firmicutes bacterium]|nr:ATPase [Bacillota bacterium]